VRNLHHLMRQLGVRARELEVDEVIFKLKDGSTLIFKRPVVLEAEVMEQKSYQVIGEPRHISIREEDVKFVAEQAGVEEERARKALEESGGDIAEAILRLQEEQ